jgi:hypothetical protein
MKTLTKEEMQQHIQHMINKHGLVTSQCDRPSQAWASRELEEICIPPIKSEISYAAALHEIGHIQGRYQTSRHSLVRELAAWRWARQHALTWTPSMERTCTSSLAWAARTGRINSGEQARGLMRVRATHIAGA